MNLNGVELIAEEIKSQNEFINNINNIYERLSTNYCEYVDKFNSVYNNIENTSNIFKTTEIPQYFNNREILHKYYNSFYKNFSFADNYKGFGGYVEKFVDNVVNKEDNYKVFHKNYDFSKNSDFLNSVNDTMSNEYKNFTDNIKNTENNNSYENNRYGVNINMGGITQNITNSDGSDIMDMLVDKLRKTIAGCGNRVY